MLQQQLGLLIELCDDWCGLKEVAHQTRDDVETSTYDVRAAEKTLFVLRDGGPKYNAVRRRLAAHVAAHRQQRAAAAAAAAVGAERPPL
eukprot:SAG22_NODE_337_length_12043_cov_58.339556_13_plen_89_part_00